MSGWPIWLNSAVGPAVGASVSSGKPIWLKVAVGPAVGAPVSSGKPIWLKTAVGPPVPPRLGASDGPTDHEDDGAALRRSVGARLAATVGPGLGARLGARLWMLLGLSLALVALAVLVMFHQDSFHTLADSDGATEGSLLGTADGSAAARVGVRLGASDAGWDGAPLGAALRSTASVAFSGDAAASNEGATDGAPLGWSEVVLSSNCNHAVGTSEGETVSAIEGASLGVSGKTSNVQEQITVRKSRERLCTIDIVAVRSYRMERG